MSRKPTPDPESRFVGGGALWAAGCSLPGIVTAAFSGQWWPLVFALPMFFYAAYVLRRLLLLAAAWWRWRDSEIRGILVSSNSPHWKEYIERTWLPRLEDHVVVLDWSKRKKWRNTLPVRVFRCFGIADDNFNFNPLAILFQGLRYPLVYRFYYAFRDSKHGRPEALRRLEQHLFAQFESSPYAVSSTRASR